MLWSINNAPTRVVCMFLNKLTNFDIRFEKITSDFCPFFTSFFLLPGIFHFLLPSSFFLFENFYSFFLLPTSFLKMLFLLPFLKILLPHSSDSEYWFFYSFIVPPLLAQHLLYNYPFSRFPFLRFSLVRDSTWPPVTPAVYLNSWIK